MIKKIFITFVLASLGMVANAGTINTSNTDQLEPITLMPGPVLIHKAKNISVAQEQLRLQQYALLLQEKLVKVQKQLLGLQRESMYGKEKGGKTLFNWQEAQNGSIPKDAFVAGHNTNGNIYICHANMEPNLGLHPGQLTKKGCMITYSGKVYIKPKYEVLVGDQKFEWRAYDSFPEYNEDNYTREAYPIVAGHEKGHDLFICRTSYKNNVYFGKVIKGACNIAYNGKEVRRANYQILLGL